MQILGLLGMHFDAVAVRVKTFLLLFRLSPAILWENLIILLFGYWATILDCDSVALRKVKNFSITSIFFPLDFAPSQASSSQNLNVDDTLEGYKIKSTLP